jgi:hypothetical protein
MSNLTLLNGFWLGVVGGAVPELYALYNLRHTFHETKPAWITSKFYWFITAVMVLLGGGTVCLYIALGVNVNHFVAIHLGMSTPLLISTALKEKPKVD